MAFVLSVVTGATVQCAMDGLMEQSREMGREMGLDMANGRDVFMNGFGDYTF